MTELNIKIGVPHFKSKVKQYRNSGYTLEKAINEFGYGPLNPEEPNRKFWAEKVKEWKMDSVKEAKSALCGNCAAFDISKKTLDCISKGIGDDEGSEDPMDVVEAGELGYCRFLKFKCAAKRTCDAWVTGGPIK